MAESGADELSVFDTGSGSLLGRIPTAAYPTDVRVTPNGRTLLWLSAKGLGTGQNLNGPNPFETTDANTNSFEYLPIITFGKSGILRFPSDSELRTADGHRRRAAAPVERAGRARGHAAACRRPDPARLLCGEGEPHLRPDPRRRRARRRRSVADAVRRPNTPNTHALARRFPLLDHVYANSEASIDGHFWTSAAKVSDYVNKNWHQNYGGRGRPYDFGVYAVTFPQNGFLFDQADRDGVSYFNYGEAIAGVVGVFPDKDRTPDVAADEQRKFAKSDLGPERLLRERLLRREGLDHRAGGVRLEPAGGRADRVASRFDCFRQRFQTQVATGTVPALNYLVLTNNHTRGLEPGARTPHGDGGRQRPRGSASSST